MVIGGPTTGRCLRIGGGGAREGTMAEIVMAYSAAQAPRRGPGIGTARTG